MKATRIATLGNSDLRITCFMDAAYNLYPDSDIKGVRTYDEAIRILINKDVDYALVAAAYPKINGYFMDDRLGVFEQKIYRIPEIVFSSFFDESEVEELYLHPATIPLFKKMSLVKAKLVEVSSNEEAGANVVKNATCCGAITNRLVAEYFEIPILKVLRPNIAMGWSLFGLNELV